MTHNNNKKLQLSFLLKIKNKYVVSFLLVLQILFFFFGVLLEKKYDVTEV